MLILCLHWNMACNCTMEALQTQSGVYTHNADPLLRSSSGDYEYLFKIGPQSIQKLQNVFHLEQIGELTTCRLVLLTLELCCAIIADRNHKRLLSFPHPCVHTVRGKVLLYFYGNSLIN